MRSAQSDSMSDSTAPWLSAHGVEMMLDGGCRQWRRTHRCGQRSNLAVRRHLLCALAPQPQQPAEPRGASGTGTEGPQAPAPKRRPSVEATSNRGWPGGGGPALAAGPGLHPHLYPHGLFHTSIIHRRESRRPFAPPLDDRKLAPGSSSHPGPPLGTRSDSRNLGLGVIRAIGLDPAGPALA